MFTAAERPNRHGASVTRIVLVNGEMILFGRSGRGGLRVDGAPGSWLTALNAEAAVRGTNVRAASQDLEHELHGGIGASRAAAVQHLGWRRLSLYADYSQPDVIDQDAAQMVERIAGEPEVVVTRGDHEATISLPHPAVCECVDDLARLGWITYLLDGQLREALFLDVLPVALTPVPSFGARHPLGLEVTIPGGSSTGVQSGRYRYQRDGHHLTPVGPSEAGLLSPSEIRLSFVAEWERVQWRYRHSAAYDMVWLDLGHLQGQVSLIEDHVPGVIELEHAVGRRLIEPQRQDDLRNSELATWTVRFPQRIPKESRR